MQRLIESARAALGALGTWARSLAGRAAPRASGGHRVVPEEDRALLRAALALLPADARLEIRSGSFVPAEQLVGRLEAGPPPTQAEVPSWATLAIALRFRRVR